MQPVRWLLLLPSIAALKPAGSYFTCRHTYEAVLVAELEAVGVPAVETAHPGLVRAEKHDGRDEAGRVHDPAYALQALPAARRLTGETAPALAKAVLAVVEESAGELDALKRGALKVHVLTPDLIKGAPKPRLLDRATRVGDAVEKSLRKRYRAARLSNETVTDPWVLQLLLLGPAELIVSLSPCEEMEVGSRWPNWKRPGGLCASALVPKEKMWTGPMPGSAYRKLLEALDCVDKCPGVEDDAVDLGAAPGSWTKGLLKLGCGSVTSVDRAPLEPELMEDERVDLIIGDAFAYAPSKPVCWLVSDIISTPDRCVSLIDDWCGKRLFTRGAIVTMKFQGEVDFPCLQTALATAASHGHPARAKHFFSNKNEVTLMLGPRR